MRSISVIVPIYNEIDSVEHAMEKIGKFFSTNFIDYELIVVESGSTDGSGKKCDQLITKIPNLRVIHENQRKGFGSALKLGYKHATKDLVTMTTCDLPFKLDYITSALPLLDKCDCVLSYRSTDPRSWSRKIMSFVYNSMAKMLFGLKTKNINSALKIYKRETIQKINLVSSGWFIDTEIVYNIEKSHIPHIEIPVELINRQIGKSSIRLKDIIAYIKEIIIFLRNRKINK